jgi:branched-chain amino acid transport system permease protein
MRAKHSFLLAVLAAISLLSLGLVLPAWLLFLVTLAAANGLAVLGIVVLTRGGGATFGQGMFFALGAYAAALAPTLLGINDALLRTLIGTLVAGFFGVLIAPLLVRYRGIFFAMLTLALSMVLFGLLSKATFLGGSDGITVLTPTLLGQDISGNIEYSLYSLTVAIALLLGWATSVYSQSAAGLMAMAVRANPLRVEYLGASARRSLGASFVLCALLGGAGGAIVAQTLGHVEPNLTNWTTSGEFVFVAVLAGYKRIPAVFVASLLLEIVRSFSNLYFPHTWQLALGAFLLLVITFRPDGLGSFWPTRTKTEAKT